jgi:hypothetical protein
MEGTDQRLVVQSSPWPDRSLSLFGEGRQSSFLLLLVRLVITRPPTSVESRMENGPC